MNRRGARGEDAGRGGRVVDGGELGSAECGPGDGGWVVTGAGVTQGCVLPSASSRDTLSQPPAAFALASKLI